MAPGEWKHHLWVFLCLVPDLTCLVCSALHGPLALWCLDLRGCLCGARGSHPSRPFLFSASRGEQRGLGASGHVHAECSLIGVQSESDVRMRPLRRSAQVASFEGLWLRCMKALSLQRRSVSCSHAPEVLLVQPIVWFQ